MQTNPFLRFSFRSSLPSLGFSWRSHTNCRTASGKSLAAALGSTSSLRPGSKTQRGLQHLGSLASALHPPAALCFSSKQEVNKTALKTDHIDTSPNRTLGTLDVLISNCKAKAFGGKFGDRPPPGPRAAPQLGRNLHGKVGIPGCRTSIHRLHGVWES